MGKIFGVFAWLRLLTSPYVAHRVKENARFDIFFRLRASQLFEALDEDGSGCVDEDEFIEGNQKNSRSMSL